MLSFDFQHITELHELPNDECQVPRSGQTRVASQQTDGPQTKLGYYKYISVASFVHFFGLEHTQKHSLFSREDIGLYKWI